MKAIITSLLLLLLYLPAKAQQNDSIQEAMDNYDYEGALALIAQEPTPSIPLLYQQGKALKGLGRNQEALTAFENIIKQDSLQTRAYIEAAACCKPLAKYRQAIAYYQQAISLQPQNKYARLQYINLLLDQKQYRTALDESNRLAQEDSSAHVLNLQAESMENCYLKDEAWRVIEAYRRIRNKYPDDYLSAAKLGNIYIAGQAYQDAIDVTEAYRAIDSTNVTVNRINAQAYCLNQDYPEAIKRYEYLLQEGDSSYQTLLYAGISYYATNYFYETHDLLTKALAEDPTSIDVLYYLGRACAKSSWKEEGINLLQKAVELATPSDSLMSRLYTGLTDSYKMARQYKKQAETILEQYHKYDRQKHHLLYRAAFVYYYRLKDDKNTEKCLKAYLKTRPQDKEQEMDNEGNPTMSENDYYNAAKTWLEDIRKHKRQERFFREGVKENDKSTQGKAGQAIPTGS